ncbi:MAG: methylmalonyl Co-A mutase-associated GTPase MeaB [Deltaproteobacteria bacterium]|nr:methylmalonyl Co-A mutase-associated GTPase MeaB [Deltaproteobacteria bacterium]
MSVDDLITRLLDGNRRALARLISLVESRAVDVAAVMSRLFPHMGRAQILGFTGPPGAGKSTLVDKVTEFYRRAGKTVGVVAIDPSSPFSGGALLGDRIRMHRHSQDTGVFIRSLGTRGSHGGLSRSTRDTVRLMDAAGLDVVMIETVGVGQTELDIMEVAHTTTVVLVPESGDVVQTMKAGLTEIADIFVVNKSDRDGADIIEKELVGMIELNPPSAWKIPVLKTQATKSVGVTDLCARIDEHTAMVKAGTVERRRIKLTADKEMVEILAGRLEDGLARAMNAHDDGVGRIVHDVLAGRENPYAAAASLSSDPELLRRIFASPVHP